MEYIIIRVVTVTGLLFVKHFVKQDFSGRHSDGTYLYWPNSFVARTIVSMTSKGTLYGISGP